MSWTTSHFEEIEVLPSPDFAGFPFELVGDDVQRLSVIQNLPNLLKGSESALCMQRIIPKIMLSLDKASTEFHMTAAPVFYTILEKGLVHPRTYAQTFLLSILSCANNKDPGISALWVGALMDAMELLPAEIIRSDIVTLAIQKGQLSQSVPSRVLAAKMLGKASTRIDQVCLKKDILPVILALCQDVNYEVRACICSQLKFLANTLEADLIKSTLLPSLVELASDEEVIVRLAAMDTIVEVLPVLKPETIKSTIIPLVKKMCAQSMSNEDDVLCTISYQFGKLCLGLTNHTTIQEKQWLVAYFQELAHLGVSNQGVVNKYPIPDLSADVLSDRYILCRQNCAYNFPAMVVFCFKLGDQFYERLYTSFCDLSSDSFFMVRRTIACGLHEIASALGSACGMVKKELVKLLRDDSEDVLQGLLPNLGKTLEQFAKAGQMDPDRMDAQTVETGRAILKCELGLSEKRDWRLHSTLLHNLEALPRAFASDFINTYFVPTMFVRVRRSRAVPVREAAGRLLLVFLRYNKSHLQRNDIRNRIITEFCRGQSCYHRLTFAKLCGVAMEIFSRRFFKDNFFMQLIELSYDKVANVRLVFVRYLPQLKKMLILPTDKQLVLSLENTTRRMLASETDRDVSHFLKLSIKQLEKITVREEGRGGPPSKEDMEDQRKLDEEKKLAAAVSDGRKKSSAMPTRSAQASGAPATASKKVFASQATAGGASGNVRPTARTMPQSPRPSAPSSAPPARTQAPPPPAPARSSSLASLEDEFYVDAGIRIPQQLAASGELPTFSSRIPNLREILFKNRNAKLVGENTSQPLVLPLNSTPKIALSSLEVQRELKSPSLPSPASLSYSSSFSTSFTITTCASSSTVSSTTITDASTTSVATAACVFTTTNTVSTADTVSPTLATSPSSTQMSRALTVGDNEMVKAEPKVQPKRISSNGVSVQLKSERNLSVLQRTHPITVRQNVIDISSGCHKTEQLRPSNTRGRTGQLEQKQKDGSVVNRRHSYMDGERLLKAPSVSSKPEEPASRKSGISTSSRRHSYIEKMPCEDVGKNSKSLYSVRRSFGPATTSIRHSYNETDQTSNSPRIKNDVTLRKSLIPSRSESGSAEMRNKRRSLTYTSAVQSRINSFGRSCELSANASNASSEQQTAQVKHPQSFSVENKRSHSSLERDDLERLKSPSFGQMRESAAVQIRTLRNSLEQINSLKASELRLDLNVDKQHINTSGFKNNSRSGEGTPVESFDVMMRKGKRLSLSKIPRGPASCHSSPGGSRASSPTGPVPGGNVLRTRQRTAPNSRSTSPTGGNMRRSQRLSLGSLNSYMSHLKLSESTSRLPVRKP